MDEAEAAAVRRRPPLGRRISRRLSLVVRVPSLLASRALARSRESISLQPPPVIRTRAFRTTVLLPGGTQRTVSPRRVTGRGGGGREDG